MDAADARGRCSEEKEIGQAGAEMRKKYFHECALFPISINALDPSKLLIIFGADGVPFRGPRFGCGCVLDQPTLLEQ
jgi:hypothetical protein